jgi:hypothetical protein
MDKVRVHGGVAANSPAQLLLSFEHHHRPSGVEQPVGRDQPVGAGADDDGVVGADRHQLAPLGEAGEPVQGLRVAPLDHGMP